MKIAVGTITFILDFSCQSYDTGKAEVLRLCRQTRFVSFLQLLSSVNDAVRKIHIQKADDY